MTPTTHELVLRGLDGTTPLGFLAALGLVRVLRYQTGMSDVDLAWTADDGGWVAKLRASAQLDQTSLLNVLDTTLVRSLDDHPMRLYQDRPANHFDFVNVCRQATVGQRQAVDVLASIASNLAPRDATSQLQVTRRDYYLDNIRSILERAGRDHLRRTLFKPWDYADPLDNQSLHLDPSEDRRHAYQWNKPSGDPNRKKRGGMLGANRLAIEALPWFPTWPVGGALRTLGFHRCGKKETCWTWPVWTPFVPADLIPSLLALAPLQDDPIAEADRRWLRQMGVVAAYRVRRILVGKTPNLTPARKVA